MLQKSVALKVKFKQNYIQIQQNENIALFNINIILKHSTIFSLK